MGEYSNVERQDDIVTVTINRVARRNALHPAAHLELQGVFDDLQADSSVRAVILTGAGDRAFCAGYDLQDNLETGIMKIADSGFGGLTFRTDFPHPLIAAVNGFAMGGGFEMALTCDIIVASETAQFALAEPKVGWVALGGGIQRLTRAIGPKRAMPMILTGRAVSAQQGRELGFVSEVVDPQDLMTRAFAIATEIAACAPLAVRCSKLSAYATLDMDLATALDPASHPCDAVVMASEDAMEGKRAFVERRSPRWTGK